MTCPICKKEISETAQFCPICGANIKENIINDAESNIAAQTPPKTIVNNSIQLDNTIQPTEKLQTQSITTFTTNENNINNKKNNKILLILIIIVIAVIVTFTLTRNEKKENTSNTTTTNENKKCYISTISYIFNESEDLLIDITELFNWTTKKVYQTAIIKKGVAKVGDPVQLVGLDKEIVNTTIESIKINNNEVTSAKAGDKIEIKLKDIDDSLLEDNQSIIKPNSYKLNKYFEGTLHLFTKEEGGRHTEIYTNFRPQIQFRTSDVDCKYRSYGIVGILTLLNETQKAEPGTDVNISAELINNTVINVGDTFTIIEGGKPIGQGKVTKVIE